MTKPSNITALFISVCLLLAIVLGCSQSKDEGPAAQKGQTNTATPSAEPASTAAAEKEIAGDYSVTGMNEDGAGRYAGDLTVTKRDDVYQFSWVSGPNTYDGVGVRSGNSIGVSFTNGADGKGCGVVLYNIASNGDLSGKAGYWGVNAAETETAKRVSGTDLEGEYQVTGKNTAGQSYSSELAVKKDGEGYGFEWTGGTPLSGFGMRRGNVAAVGFGGQQCAFVLYEAKPDGTLEGKWGGQGSTSFGTETAKRK